MVLKVFQACSKELIMVKLSPEQKWTWYSRSDSLPNIDPIPRGFYPHLKPFWLPWTMCDTPVSLYILYTVSSNPIPKLPLATSKEFRLHRQKLHKLPSHADTAAKKLANNAWTLVHCIANCVKWCFETLSEYCNWVPPAIQTSIAGNSSNSRWFNHSTWGFPIRFQPSYDIVNHSVLGINHSKSIPIRIAWFLLVLRSWC